MKKIKVIAGQTLFDIAVQVYGDIRAVVLLAKANDIAMTQKLIPAAELVLPTSEFTDIDVLRAFPLGKKIATTTQEPVATTDSDYILPGILPMSL